MREEFVFVKIMRIRMFTYVKEATYTHQVVLGADNSDKGTCLSRKNHPKKKSEGRGLGRRKRKKD